MQCSCGAETKDHEVVRNGAVVGVYARCCSRPVETSPEGCGRICWRWITDELRDELSRARVN